CSEASPYSGSDGPICKSRWHDATLDEPSGVTSTVTGSSPVSAVVIVIAIAVTGEKTPDRVTESDQSFWARSTSSPTSSASIMRDLVPASSASSTPESGCTRTSRGDQHFAAPPPA